MRNFARIESFSITRVGRYQKGARLPARSPANGLAVIELNSSIPHLFSRLWNRANQTSLCGILATSMLIGWFSVACPAPATGDAALGQKVPGIVINHIPADSGEYIGSPSLAILPNGKYVASHDHSGGGNPRTSVFISNDRGTSWRQTAEIKNQFWSSLFFLDEALYLIGTRAGMSAVVIRKSVDTGRTWSDPIDSNSGILRDKGQYHCAPGPVVVHQGRIWKAFEEFHPASQWETARHGRDFSAFVMSAPVGADLRKSENWTNSNKIRGNRSWLSGSFRGWLEGNIVITPDGALANLLCVRIQNLPERAAVMRVAREGKTVTFDPEEGFVHFPGGSKKFTIRRDPVTGGYWSLANTLSEEPVSEILRPIAGLMATMVRNTLSLTHSIDLKEWKIVAEILHHPDEKRHGFQYADWQFDGDDIVFVSRTAYDDDRGGAPRQHDANYLTFHRVENFRSLPGKANQP